MIEIFVRRPVTTVMFVLFLVLLGFQSFFNLNIERYPPIEFPIVAISTTYPGASPEEIESDVLIDIEDAVVEVSDIKNITSDAYNDFGLTIIEFNYGTDVDIKSIEVKDKVEAIVNDLPDLVETPIITKVDPTSTPVLDIILKSDKHSLKELWTFADDKLKPALTSISGISSVDIIGGREREIKVQLDSSLLQKNYLTISDVINTIKSSNINYPGGTIKQENSELNIKFFGEFQSIEEIENLILTTPEGKIVKIKDIAKVIDGEKDAETISMLDNQEIVLLSLIKVSDGNAVKIAESLNKKMPSLLKSLEDGMELDVTNDETVLTIKETFSTIKSVAVGILLTVIVLIAFTGNVKSTFIVTLVIPSSIIATLFLIQMAGFSINSMTLLAFGTVLGTLIANAIIILDSAIYRLSLGESSEEAAIKGTRSVIGEVLASSGTNLAVFIPIASMDGIVGDFMAQFGMTVVYTTILSILISFSLTPMLIATIFKVKDSKATVKESKKTSVLVRFSNKINDILLKEYKALFDFMFKFKIISLILIVGIFFYFMSLAKYIGNEFFPASDSNQVQISFKTPNGSSLEKTKAKAQEVRDRIKDFEGVKYITAKIGEDGNENANVIAELVDINERSLSDLDLIEKIIPAIDDIPDIEADVTRGSSGGPEGADITLNVYASNFDDAIKHSKEIQNLMNEMGSFRSVTSSYRNPPYEYRFVPNQEKLKLYGISNSQISLAIRNSLYGDDEAIYKENNKQYDIRVELLDKDKNNGDFFKNIYVVSSQGLISLSELGSVKLVESIPGIKRHDRKRIIEINAYISKGTSGVLQSELDSLIKENIEFGVNDGYYYAGNSEIQGETNSSLGIAFLLAIIFTYMILAAIMNSLLHPFTIAISIASSFSGVILLFFFTGFSFNMPSMMACIMLVGLTVNAAILLVNNALIKITDEGLDIVSALWESATERFRTILMTSTAIIFGTLPQIFATDAGKASMGAVIIGGMIASVIFTLTLTPLVFYYFEKLKQKLFKH